MADVATQSSFLQCRFRLWVGQKRAQDFGNSLSEVFLQFLPFCRNVNEKKMAAHWFSPRCYSGSSEVANTTSDKLGGLREGPYLICRTFTHIDLPARHVCGWPGTRLLSCQGQGSFLTGPA